MADETTKTETISLFGPNANPEMMEHWAEKQQEWDYRSYQALRELLSQLRHVRIPENEELEDAIKQANYVSESRHTASENLLRATNGQDPLPMPTDPEWE